MRNEEVLTYTNELGESLAFSYSSIFCPQQPTEGLSGARSSIYSFSSMGQAGDTFVSARIETRDVAISGVIRERDPGQFRAYRRLLARVLNPMLEGSLTYTFGEFSRVIPCRPVNEPVVTKGPRDIYPKFSVQFACMNPYWREATEQRNDIAAWVGAFEFPVEIPELHLDGTGGMELGYRMPSLIVNVVNDGDIECGLKVCFTALERLSNPSIIDVNTGKFIRLNLDMVYGDMLMVSTGYGEKWATLTRGGIDSDALRYVDIDSTFLQLKPGDNLLRYDAEDGLDNLEVTIFHSNLYLGV